MTRMSGWCLDELQAAAFNRPAVADRLHNRCHIETCTCPNHEGATDG